MSKGKRIALLAACHVLMPPLCWAVLWILWMHDLVVWAEESY